MVRTSARPSLWKTICSSRRFRNSGLKYCRTSPRTTSSTRYFVYSAPSSAVLPGSELGPGGSRVQRRGPGSGSSEASTAGIASRAASTARTRADRLPDRTPWMSRAPMFEVSTMRAFLKLTTRPYTAQADVTLKSASVLHRGKARGVQELLAFMHPQTHE
eukprot:364416-Chlamydomonas_euryale.AAC.15